MTSLRFSAPLRVFAILFALNFHAAHGQAPATSGPGQTSPAFQPVAASLSLPLDISRLKEGSHIQAYVQAPWANGSCELRLGALLEGHVSDVVHQTKTDKNSSMHVVFDAAECNRHKGTPLRLTLIALLGPDASAPGGESGVGQNPSLTDVPNPIGGLRSVERASNAYQYALPGHSVPQKWKPGMVVYVPDTTLTFEKGNESVTILTAQKKNVRLEANTLLIMEAASTVPTPPPAPAANVP